MKEVWQDIAGYAGSYQVSNWGRVKSMAKCWELGGRKMCLPERIMTLQPHRNGYLQVHLRKPMQHKKFFVHRLVAAAFCDGYEGCQVVNHKDRDKAHNYATNLECVTYKENTAHWMADDAAKDMAF